MIFLVLIISRTDWFQNNVFEILNDFCQKFEFRLRLSFSYKKLMVSFTSERSRNEEIRFTAISPKMFNFNHLFFTPNSLCSKFPKWVFIVSRIIVLLRKVQHLQWVLLHSSLAFIYTIAFNVQKEVIFLVSRLPLGQMFKFVDKMTEAPNEKSSKVLFFCKHKKIQFHSEKFPARCAGKFPSLAPKKMRSKRKQEKCFHFRLQAEQIVILSFAVVPQIIDWMFTFRISHSEKNINLADRTEILSSLQFRSFSFCFIKKRNALQIQLNFTSIYLSRYPPWLVILFVANFYTFVWFNEKLK